MSAAAAKALTALANYLKQRDEDGERNVKKIIFLVMGLLLTIGIVVEVATSVMNIPMNALTEFFLPESIVELRRIMDESFERPIIGTDEIGLLPLPVTNSSTSSPFGWRILRGSPNWHEGLDFPVAFDTPVMSVADGVVVATGVDKNYGTFIKLEHTMRIPEYEDEDGEIIEEEVTVFYSFYAHLYKSYAFKGDTVLANQRIATSGGDPARHFAGNVTGAHLHFEIRTTPSYGSQLDPYDWLLKPLSSEERKKQEKTTFDKPRNNNDYDY